MQGSINLLLGKLLGFSNLKTILEDNLESLTSDGKLGRDRRNIKRINIEDATRRVTMTLALEATETMIACNVQSSRLEDNMRRIDTERLVAKMGGINAATIKSRAEDKLSTLINIIDRVILVDQLADVSCKVALVTNSNVRVITMITIDVNSI